MKRIFCAALCCVSIFCSVSTVFAANEPVVDKAELFLDAETESLNGMIREAVEYTNMDIVILTTNYTSGKSSMRYADDYYDNFGYGIGEDYSGLLLLINMGEREVWISTCGKAIDYYNDKRIDRMLDEIYDYLTNENYFEACIRFVELVKEYYDYGLPSSKSTFGSFPLSVLAMRSLSRIWIYILISAAIGGVAVLIMISANKGKTTVDKNTYAISNKFKLTTKNDRFVTMVHSTHVINNNNRSGGFGGGGGSSVHTGSSGRTHGGGGRKF